MKLSIKKGFSFGLTSGIITTLGLIVGLNSSTGSQLIIIGGIVVIAVSDALSDALGVHISEEAENQHSHKEVWETTIATFLSKFFFALLFIIPILLLELNTAIYISITWGFSLIALFSYRMAKEQNSNPSLVIFEHVIIAIIVIVITHFVGEFIATLQ